jgi:crotonobetainyl-CoA:carnitine CoA-transferase CaiB-like acyl-CoA transferase
MDYLRTVEHETGPIETVGPPFRIEGLRLGGDQAASPVNRDARRILREVGLGDAEIDHLLRD